jgi:hypothetical protein
MNIKRNYTLGIFALATLMIKIGGNMLKKIFIATSIKDLIDKEFEYYDIKTAKELNPGFSNWRQKC